MSINLSLTGNQNNFGFTHALVFSPGKPGSNWFKATVGDSLVMVFYPDDQSVTSDMIEPGDTIYVAGLKEMEVKGTCDKKANCAPLALQMDSFKNAIKYRQNNMTAQETLTDILFEKSTEVESEPASEATVADDFKVDIDHSYRFSGVVNGKANVDYVKAKKEKYAARGRYRSMYAMNEIIERARKNEC